MNAEKLKEYRKRNSLMQGELAKIVKTSIRAVQSWEQGLRKVPQSAITLMELNDGITEGRDIITGAKGLYMNKEVSGNDNVFNNGGNNNVIMRDSNSYSSPNDEIQALRKENEYLKQLVEQQKEIITLYKQLNNK